MLARLATPYLRRMNTRLLRFGEGQGSDALPSPLPGRRYLLYVHVPFCKALCPFCSFHRVRYDESLALRYFAALRREIEHYARLGFQFSDVYVGGGTPTVNLPELLKTLDVIHHNFAIDRISVETNPDHLRTNILHDLKAAGVNRLSVGVQSFDDRLLKEMQRYDRYGSGVQMAARLEAAAGMLDTLNVDMMFNYPHQHKAMLDRDLDQLLELGIDQVSFYPLMAARSVERNMRRHMGKIDYRTERALYLQILDRMTGEFETSSVWCFSRAKGMVDEYIVDHDQYVGVGSGSFSYLDGTLYATSFSILDYDRHIEQNRLGISRARTLTRREQLRFFLLTSLFATHLDFEALATNFGDTARKELAFELRALRTLGTIRLREGHAHLTRRGHHHWLVLMREFLNAINNLRDEMRSHSRAEFTASYPDSVQPVTVR